MGFVAALLLLVKLAGVEPIFQPRNNCGFSVSVLPRQLYTFNNPNFPGTYTAGVTCRWIYNCPQEYSCRLVCRDVGLPTTQGCFMDRLLVSNNGNLFFEGAQVFCGRTSINATSIGSRITMGLMSRAASPGGRFRCTVRTEPWAYPFLSTSQSIRDLYHRLF